MKRAMLGLLSAAALALATAGAATSAEVPPPEATPGAVPETHVCWPLAQLPETAVFFVTVRSLPDLEERFKAYLRPVLPEEALTKSVSDVLEASLPADAIDLDGPVVLTVAVGLKPSPIFMMRLKDPAKLRGQRDENGVLQIARPPVSDAEAAGPIPHREQFYGLEMRAPADAGPARWVALADSPRLLQLLASPGPRIQVTPEMARMAEDNLAWAHLNIRPLAMIAKTALMVARSAMQESETLTPEQAATVQIMDWADRMLVEAEAVDLAVNVSEERLTADLGVTLAERSALLGIAESLGPIEGYADRLPAADRFIVASWHHVDFEQAMRNVQTLLGPVKNALVTMAGDKLEPALVQSIDEAWGMMAESGRVIGNEGAYLAEIAPPGEGMMRMVQVSTVRDPDGYRRLQTRGMTVTENLMNALFKVMARQPGQPSMGFETEYRSAVEEIEGVPVDRFRFNVRMALPEGTPPEAQKMADEMMKSMYGPEGMAMRLALVDKLAVAASGDKANMVRAIRAARGRGDDLAEVPLVRDALRRVPEGSGLVGLVSLPTYGHLIGGTMAQMIPQIAASAAPGAEPPAMPQLPTPSFRSLTVISGRLEGRVAHLAFDVPQPEITETVEIIKTLVEGIQDIERRAAPPGGGTVGPVAHPAGRAPAAR